MTDSILYFRLGDMLGFTASKLADQKPGFAIPIRELMQNSLDASREAQNEKCEVNIFIEYINRDEIPCIDEYRKILLQAINSQNETGSYQNQQKQIVTKIKETLKQKTIPILTFVDNGKGLTPQKLEALLSERSHKDCNNSSGGSYGVGHLSAYFLSSLRYVLYTSRYCGSSDGQMFTLFSGSPILAGYQDKDSEESQRGAVGVIVAQRPENERNPTYSYLAQPPSFLQDKFRTIEDTGTIVSILGLSEEWGADAEYAIASHFFHALAHESLEVTIHRQYKPTISMSEILNQCLFDNRTIKNAKRSRGEILSGQATWQSYLAVTERNNVNRVCLSNGDQVYVHINSSRDVTESSVALIRSDMLVARHDCMVSPTFDKLRKNPDLAPFALVIDVDHRKAPFLFDLVKKAEGPHHNELVTKDLSDNDEKELRELLEELSNRIEQSHLKKIDRTAFNLPLFTVPERAKESSSHGTQISSNTRTAKSVKRNSKTPQRNAFDQKQPRNRNRKLPKTFSRQLDAQISARSGYANGLLTTELHIVPNNVHEKDDTWLSFCLGEDKDNNSGASAWLKIVNLTLNDESIDIDEENKEVVTLGSLKKGNTYRISACLLYPEQQSDKLKFALQPVLGLRRR